MLLKSYLCVPAKILYYGDKEDYLCKANLCAKIYSMFSLIILAHLVKDTTFFHLPCLPFSAYRFQASWDPFDHIWYLRTLLPNACFLYFDLTVQKITLFSRKSSVDRSRDAALGKGQVKLAAGPLGWSGASREENEEKSCASCERLHLKRCVWGSLITWPALSIINQYR